MEKDLEKIPFFFFLNSPYLLNNPHIVPIIGRKLGYLIFLVFCFAEASEYENNFIIQHNSVKNN